MTVWMVRERSAPYGEGPEKARIPERLLARLWKKRAARQAWFRTKGGGRVRVLYPGRGGNTAGPDFRDALIEVEGLGLVRGDVEIHLTQRDWDRHGHGSDPNYNGVVLHAALEAEVPADESTTLQSGRQVPVVTLEQLLLPVVDDVAEDQDEVEPPLENRLWPLLTRLGYPHPQTPEELAALLDRAGDQRFLAKAAYFSKALGGEALGGQSPDQVLYEALMEGLGYSSNQRPFLKLAGQANYPALERASRRHFPRDASLDRALGLESWLLKLSGLASGELSDKTSLTRVGFGAAMSPQEWHLFRLRPANHPRNRIKGVAVLLYRYLEPGLARGISRLAQGGGPKELTGALMVGANANGPGALVGKDRAGDLAVNGVLPFLYGWPRRNPNAAWATLNIFSGFTTGSAGCRTTSCCER